MATAFSLDRFTSASPLARARAVAKGLPAKAVRDLIADKAVTVADLSRVVGPRRTLDRRLKDNAPLSPQESDRFARFVTVLDIAASIFGTRAEAMDWLSAPKRRFDGDRPLDMLKNGEGARLVEELLVQGQHGMLA